MARRSNTLGFWPILNHAVLVSTSFAALRVCGHVVSCFRPISPWFCLGEVPILWSSWNVFISKKQLPSGHLIIEIMENHDVWYREIICFQGPSFTLTEQMLEETNKKPLNKVAKTGDDLDQILSKKTRCIHGAEILTYKTGSWIWGFYDFLGINIRAPSLASGKGILCSGETQSCWRFKAWKHSTFAHETLCIPSLRSIKANGFLP